LRVASRLSKTPGERVGWRNPFIPHGNLAHVVAERKNGIRHEPPPGTVHVAPGKQGVKGQAIRWYAIRVAQYRKASPGKKLRTHTVEDLTGYLKSAGESGANGRLTAWQFLRTVDAIQNLLRTAGVGRERMWT